MLVSEYITRKKLAQIGYRFDGNELDSFTAECFEVIGSEIDKLNQDEMKKAQRGSKAPKRGRR